MSGSEIDLKRTVGEGVPGTATTRLSGSWRLVARVIWLVLVVPGLALYVGGLPVYYWHIQSACMDAATCMVAGALPARELQEIANLGLSASAYAAMRTGFSVLSIAIWGGVGLLIFWRRPDDWLALLAAFVLAARGVSASGSPAYALTLDVRALTWMFSLVAFLGQVALTAILLFFPNGRLVSRWVGPLLPLGIIYAFFNSFPSAVFPYTAMWPVRLSDLSLLVFPGGLIATQIYRTMRMDTPLQRQQTRWIAAAGTVPVSVTIGSLVAVRHIPSLATNAVFGVVRTTAFSVALLLIPIAFGFSILRYRLYDIDVLINRALVYGSLTVLLALAYAVGVIGGQTIVGSLTHSTGEQQSPLVVVMTTLVIAALFRPVRRRIQAFIDRRFYRRKYDAEQALAAFGTALRQEVDLEPLGEQLVAVVHETMQPAHVSLWLRPPQRSAS
jgi:hypothetical protein